MKQRLTRTFHRLADFSAHLLPMNQSVVFIRFNPSTWSRASSNQDWNEELGLHPGAVGGCFARLHSWRRVESSLGGRVGAIDPLLYAPLAGPRVLTFELRRPAGIARVLGEVANVHGRSWSIALSRVVCFNLLLAVVIYGGDCSLVESIACPLLPLADVSVSQLMSPASLGRCSWCYARLCGARRMWTCWSQEMRRRSLWRQSASFGGVRDVYHIIPDTRDFSELAFMKQVIRISKGTMIAKLEKNIQMFAMKE
eukprot:766980-Hanusia_phi.AAC.8